MDVLLDQTVIFAFLLALALLIERFLEVTKSIYDYIDLRLGMDQYWTARAKLLQQKIEANIIALEKGNHERIGALVRQFADKMIGGGDNGVITISGDLLRATTIRFVAKLLAIAIGVGMALGFHLDLVAIWQGAVTTKITVLSQPYQIQFGEGTRQFITGIALGLGSAPLHKLITTIEKQQKKRQAKKSGARNA